MKGETECNNLAYNFFRFRENHICQNLGQNDAITFFIDFCTIINYKWRIFFIFKFFISAKCVYRII